MKFFVSILAITLGVFMIYGFALAAEDNAGAKIGVVNLQKIISESKAGKEAKSVFDKEVSGKSAMLQAREKEVRNLESELKDSTAKLKADARRAKEEKLADAIKDLKRLKQDLEDELKKKDTELTSSLVKDIIEIIQKMGAEGKYTVVMQTGPQLIYIDKVTDLSDEVIKRYDSKYTGK